jgi:hypothetical protein
VTNKRAGESNKGDFFFEDLKKYSPYLEKKVVKSHQI